MYLEFILEGYIDSQEGTKTTFSQVSQKTDQFQWQIRHENYPDEEIHQQRDLSTCFIV